MVKFTRLEVQLLINWVLIIIFLSGFFLFIDNAFSVDYQIKELNKNLTVPNYYLFAKAQKNMIYTDFGTQFQFRIGEVASINSGEVELKLLEVAEDSRCPSDLKCFEAGQIQITVKILVDEQDLGNLNLSNNASRKDLAIKRFDNYVIEFVKAQPYPKSNQKIELSDYVVTLRVCRA
jgi:hypothetical protein